MTTPMTSDELAFLGLMGRNPSDDTPRLVYADWLDDYERYDEAAFVRASVRLRQDMTTVRDGSAKFTPEWLASVFGSYCVTITAYDKAVKVNVIKAVRDTTQWGLAQTKYAVEHLPCRVWATKKNLDIGSFTFQISLPSYSYSVTSLQEKETFRPLLYPEAEELAEKLRAIRRLRTDVPTPAVEFVVEPFVVPNPPPPQPPATVAEWPKPT